MIALDINNMSPKLKERFCTDCNIPIKIYQEPYFMDRLLLYDSAYHTISKWNRFLSSLARYENEQDYYEDYNRVKDEAINAIKESEAYQMFNNEDMNKFRVTNIGLPGKDIFHPSNDGRIFISIDMKKANFSALKHYGETIGKSMFHDAHSWEEFLYGFTDNVHILNSKYIRQVILGNCNPKRHITYEKYLMDNVLNQLYDCVSKERCVFFSNDEIIFDMTDCSDMKTLNLVYDLIVAICNERIDYPLDVEMFVLHKITGTDGYFKEIVKPDIKIEFKCLDSYMLPFVIRKKMNLEVEENDKVFYHNGLLAKFIEVPEIGGI